MFESLSDRLSQSLRGISGKARLSDENIQETLREVRMALLEADVALPVVKDFVESIKQRALGQEVMKSLSPGQAFLKIVQNELEEVMGAANEGLNLATKPPAVILMAGLQGAGKTTSVAKLAKLLKERDKKKVTVVSADVYLSGGYQAAGNSGRGGGGGLLCQRYKPEACRYRARGYRSRQNSVQRCADCGYCRPFGH